MICLSIRWDIEMSLFETSVIPAKAGIHIGWIPAYASMTKILSTRMMKFTKSPFVTKDYL